MFTYKHLKDRQYYEDLYDRITVNACRRSEKSFEKVFEKKFSTGRNKYTITVANPFIYFEKGERYLEREDAIHGWMNRDRQQDEKLEQARIPTSKCQFCGDELELFEKSIEHEKIKEGQVVFNFRCVRCKYGRKIWDDGDTKDIIPWECPKCGKKMSHVYKRNGNTIRTKDDCPHCGYKNSDTFSLGDCVTEKPDPEEEKRFYLDKKRFCITPQEGEEYRLSKDRLSSLSDMMKGIDERQKREEKLKSIKKLTIAQVETELKKALGVDRFDRLNFEMPNTQQGVIVRFSLQDRGEREANDSKKIAKKIITKALANTNWRLMSEGLDYRLGILTGRLRGYELEEDLLELVEKTSS